MVDAVTAAKVGTALAGINGLYCGLAPEPAAEAYGVKPASFELLEMIKSLGNSFVSSALLSILVLNGMGLGMAMAWSTLPWILSSLDGIWNGTNKKMGMPDFAPYLFLSVCAAAAYCGWTDTSMPLAAKLFAGWNGLNGALFAIAPAKGAESWGMKGDAKFNAMFKNFGYTLLSYAALIVSLVQGVDAPKAVGYSFAVMLVSLIDGLFVSKTFEDVSDDKMPAYIWMAIQSAVVGLTVVMSANACCAQPCPKRGGSQ